MNPAVQEQLKVLRHHLHVLHSAFLESLRYRFEIAKGQPVNAYTWFHIVTQDPDYTWIKPFNEIVMDLDILLENNNAGEEDASTIRTELDGLFAQREGNPFAQKFLEILVNDSDLMLNYHHFKSTRDKVPALKEVSEPAAQMRLRWRSQNQINMRASARKQTNDD